MNEEDLKKKIGDAWDLLDKKHKKEIMNLIEQVEEHKVMHPLGKAFRIGGCFIYIITNSHNECRFVYENKQGTHYFDIYGQKTEKGQKLREQNKGAVYNFYVQSPKRLPQTVLDAILSEDEFSTLFKRVSAQEDYFVIQTKQVLTKKSMAKCFALAIQRAGKVYDLKVTKIKKASGV